MWNEKVLEEHTQRTAKAKIGGGEKRIERQHSKGKLTARERLDLLFDKGSFHELEMLRETRATDFGMAEKATPGDGVVIGYGKINGKVVCASSQDFTVCGGAGGEEYALKICHILQKAIEMKVPFVNINDSGGARIEEGICSLSAYSRLFKLNTEASGYIPQIAVIMGPCAGGASYSPALCDFIFMVDKNSQMYITGPKVVRAVTGEEVDVETLGGAEVHIAKSGVAHFSFPTEKECIENVKNLLSYLPQNCDNRAAAIPTLEPLSGKKLYSIVPDQQRQVYDVHDVINIISDRNSFFEVHKRFAPNVVVGLCRINGESVGVIANQPRFMAGSLDCDAADKVARFVRFCDCFNIPIVSFVDVPAFLPGTTQEYKGIIRHGAKILYSFAEATVPKICIILRKAYGGAFCAMNSKDIGADIVYAWPIAQIAVMGAEGAVNIVFRKEIEIAENPEQAKNTLVAQYEEKFMNPYFAASRGFVDEVILPEQTREKIMAGLNALREKKTNTLIKKHGNIPL